MKTVFKQFSKKTLSMIIAFAVVICSFGTTLSTFMDLGAKAVGVEHFEVTYGSPAVPMFEKTTINLYDLKVQFAKGGAFVDGTEITWSAEAGTPAAEYLNATNSTFTALGTGIFKVTATETANTANTKSIYIMVNEKDDFSFALAEETGLSLVATYDASKWVYGEGGTGNYIPMNTPVYVTAQPTSATFLNVYGGYSRVLYYKSDILADFADYTLSTKVKISGEDGTKPYRGVVTRAQLNANAFNSDGSVNTTATNVSVVKPGTSAMYLTSYNFGGLNIGGYYMAANGESAPFTNVDHSVTYHTVDNSDDLKIVNRNPSYVLSTYSDSSITAVTSYRDIVYKLEGNNIVYSIDGNTILDTNESTISQMSVNRAYDSVLGKEGTYNVQPKTPEGGDYDHPFTDDADVANTEINSYVDSFGAEKGTFGFLISSRTALTIDSFKVTINGVDGAEDMPIASAVSLETITADAPVLSTTTNTVLDLSNYIYAFESGAHIGTIIDFVTSDYNPSVNESYLTISGKTFTATKAGVYAVEAAYGSEKLTLFVKVTNTANADVYTVKNSSPAVPMFVKTKFDLSNVIVEFANGNYYYGNDITWTVDESNTTNSGYVLSDAEKTMGVLKKGNYVLKATVTTDSGIYSRKVYFIVNEKDDYDFYLLKEDYYSDYESFDESDWMFVTGSDVTTKNFYNTELPENNEGKPAGTYWGFYYPRSGNRYFEYYHSEKLGIMFFKADILKDFSDYTFSTDVIANTDYSSGAARGFVLRADVNFDAPKDSATSVFNTSGLYLGQHRYGAVNVGAFGKLLLAGSSCFHEMPVSTIHSLSGDGYLKFVNSTDNAHTSDSDADTKAAGAYPNDPNYVLSLMNSGDANRRTVSIKLSGNDIVYKLGENTLLDTTKTVYELTGYDRSSTPVNEEFDYQSAIKTSGTTNAGGAIGFYAKQGMMHIYGFSVKLNVSAAADMPDATEYNPETISAELKTTVDAELDLSKYMYDFETGTQAGSNVTFAFSDRNASVNEQYATITGGTFKATKPGVYTVDAIYGAESITFQIFVSAAADKELYKVIDRSPAVPMFVNTRLDIDELTVQFENGQYFYGRDITWSIDESNSNDSGVVLSNENKTFAPIETGTFVLKATVTTDNGTLSRIVYFVVNNKGDYNFYLVNLDLTLSGDNAYKPEEWVNATGSGVNNFVVRSGKTEHSNGISPGYASTGMLVYNNPMLQNFADYTVEYDILGVSTNLSQAVSFIARAKLDSNVQAGDSIFTSTGSATGYNAFALQYPLYGGPAIQNFTTQFNTQDLWEKVGYSTATFNQVKYSETPSDYVFGGTGTVSIKLSGSDVISSVDGVVLFDTSAETLNKYEFEVNYANCEDPWSDHADIIQNTGTVTGSELKQIIANQTNTGKGTVGISMIRADAHSRRLTALRIKLNDTTADSILPAEEYNPYIVKSTSPALPMTAGTKINLSDFMIQLGAFAYEADDLTFGSVAAVQNGAVANGVKVEGGAIKAYKRGVYSVTVSANDGSNRSAKVYIVVKNADEDEYVIYDKDYRSDGVSVSDWTTTVTDDAGNIIANGKYFTEYERVAEKDYDKNYVPSYEYMLSTKTENGVKYYIYHKATKTVALNFSGNYADKVGMNGFVPYDTSVFQNGFSHTTGNNYSPVNVYTTLNNAVVDALADYTITASFKASPGARGAIGVQGRINGTVGYGFASGAKDAYNISGSLPLNAPFAISGTALSAFTDNAGVSNYFYNTVSFSNYTYRVYSVKYSGSEMTLSAPNGATKTLSGIANAAGKVGFVTYNKDTFSGYNATPVLAEFKVSIKDVDLSNLPTSSIDGYTAESTTKSPVYVANNNVKFVLNSDKALSGFGRINSSKPYPEKMVIPSVVDGVKTTVINYSAFQASKTDDNAALAKTLGEVVISDGISVIYDSAFREQMNLDTITLPKTLETIGQSAFSGTGIIDLTIPSSTLTIGKYAFSGVASMRSLVIGGEQDKTERLYKSQLTTITDAAFQNCSTLATVELPIHLKKIGEKAFNGCTMLDKLYVYSRTAVFGANVVPVTTTIYGATGSTAEQYANANGNPFVAIDSEIAAVEQAYEDYLVAVEAAAQLKANTEDTGVVYEFYKKTNDATGGVAGLIPSNPNAGKFVLPLIGSYTSDITGQTFTDFKVTYVKSNAFKESAYKSSIYNVVIPEGYTEIQDSAFAGCTELRYITLPDTLNYIRNYAFTNNTWLKSIEFPKNLGEIGNGAFQGSSRLVNVTFADSAACYTIGESAFQGTAIETIKLPVLLRNIGAKAFADTPLTDVYIYNRDAVIGEDAFPTGTTIHGVAGSTAQAYAKENGYTFVADVTDTWDTVINKVDPTGKFTFNVDSNGKYRAVTYSAGGKIVVPYEIDYKAADGTVTKGALVTKVAVNMFKNVYYRFQVTALVVPEGATVIEGSSFIGCSNLVSLTLPSTLQRIESWAFSSADIHGELVFGINCNFIGQSAFANNNNLEAVYIYNPNCVIEDDAFVYSTNISINEKVTKEQRVKIYGVKGSTAETYASKNDHEFIEIQAGKFPEISAIKDNGNYVLTGDAATSTVVGYARKDASKPYSEKVVFPAKLNGAAMTTIQGSLFKQKPYTSSLVAVVIEEGYTTIGDSAFSGCERLTRVQLPSTLTEINNSAFANTAIAGDLVIPESVTKIGGSAFAGCTNLTSVTITNPTVTIGPNAFSEMAKGFTIRGLTGSTAEEYYTKYKKYGIKFEAIGEYIDPNAPVEGTEPGENGPGSTQQNKGDENDNRITLFGVQVDDLTLIIIIGIGALMLLLLIAGVVIVIIVVNSNDDDDDDDDDDDEDDDEDEDEDDDEYDDEDE